MRDMRGKSLILNLFKRVSSVGREGLGLLAVLLLTTAIPSAVHPLSNPANDAAGLSIRLRPRDSFPPSRITDLGAATTFREGEALLQWTAPKADDLPAAPNDPISEYIVRYATYGVADLGGDSTSWWNRAADAVNEPAPPLSPPDVDSFILTGLEPGATVYFGIRGRDSSSLVSLIDIPSQDGPQANLLVPDFPPPVVTGLGVNASSNAVTLSWSASTATDLSSYRVYWDTSSPADVFTSTVTLPAGTTSYAFTGLAVLNTYYFYVTALDKGQPSFAGGALESSPSAIASAFLSGVPAPPFNFRAVAVSTASITWEWVDNSANEDGFRIYSATGGLIAQTGPSPGSGSAAQYVETGLTPNISAARLVKSFNISGESLASNTTTAVTLANPPAGTALTGVFITSATLSWNANNNPAGTLYRVERSTEPGFGASTASAPVTAQSYADTGLSPSTTYFWRVRAENIAGTATVNDSTVTARTLSTLIRGLTATGKNHQVLLDWEDSIEPNLLGYHVYRSSFSIGPFARLTTAPAAASGYQDHSLTNGVTLYYAVTTINAASEESVFSNIVFAVPRKDVGPQEPLGVIGSLDSSGIFTLRWSPVTMDVAGSTDVELAGYKIFKSTDVEGPYQFRDLVPPATNFWTATELVPPVVWYLLRSFDISGNESVESAHVQTLAPPVIAIASEDETARVLFTADDAKMLAAATNETAQDIRVTVTRVKDDEQGRVLNAYEIKSVQAASGTEIKDLNLKKPSIELQFRFMPGLRPAYVKSGTAFNFLSGSPRDTGIFWHNSVEFVKFGGNVDEDRGTISIKTAKPLGKFQVRQVKRASEFTLNQLTPRKIFTPNGDGVNDEITLFLDNPNDSIISQAKVYDITGAEVSDFKQGIVAGVHGVVSLTWDGRDKSGSIVRSGVYVYQIQSEGKVINGTIVVAR